MEPKEEIFNHKKAAVSDDIRLVAELEHIRAHALRSAVVAEGTEDEMFYLVTAQRAKELRRQFMQDHYPNIDSKLWCMCKSAACLRQVAYEIWGEKAEFLKQIDTLVDDIWGKATGEDLSDCEACKDDKGEL
jgi:hypothetical protein